MPEKGYPLLPVRLDGRVALVTGAGGGLGREMAGALAACGAAVALVDRDDTAIVALAATIEAAGGRVLHFAADVTDAAAMDRSIAVVREAFGPVDTLVTAAGVLIAGLFEALEEADWDRLYRINVHGTALAARLCLPDMVARGHGRVVLLSSALALFAVPERAAYAATKAAVSSLARSLAVEYGRHGITVNALAPTAVETDLNRHLIAGRSDIYRPLIESTPAGRLCTARDVVNLMLWLVSDQAAFVTGATHTLDGGFTSC